MNQGGGFGTGGGTPDEIIEQDVYTVTTVGAGYKTASITISEAYDPTKYYPVIQNIGLTYSTTGAEYLYNILYWQDFANKQIDIKVGAHGAGSFKLAWQIRKASGGRSVQQGTQAINFATGANVTDTVALSAAVHATKHEVKIGLCGDRYPTDANYLSLANGLYGRASGSVLTLTATYSNHAGFASTLPYIVIY